MEDEPTDTSIIRINTGEREIRGTPDNMTLILHRLGHTMLDGVEIDNDEFDCLLYDEDDEDPEAPTACVFRGAIANFDEVAEVMMDAGFPCHFNVKKVSEEVLGVYQNYIDNQADYIASQTDFDSELDELLSRGEDDECDGK